MKVGQPPLHQTLQVMAIEIGTEGVLVKPVLLLVLLMLALLMMQVVVQLAITLKHFPRLYAYLKLSMTDITL